MKIISTSATATQQIAETFNAALAVKPLPPEFDGKMSKMYATGKSRRNYETLAVFTAATVARIYAAFDMINYIVINGAEFEDMLDVNPDDFVKRVKSNVDMSAMRINLSLNGDKLSREMKAILGDHLSNAEAAIIENSMRYPGGRDIILSGTPCPTSPLAGAGNFNVLNNQGSDRPRVDLDSHFEQANIGTYSSEVAQNAIRVAKVLHKEIFGEARTSKNLYQAKMVRIPLDKDWQVFNALLRSIHPKLHAVDIDLFSNLDKSVVDALGDFMMIGMRSIPGKAMIDRKMQAMKVSHDTPADFNDVAIATDVRAEGGLIVCLEKEMVEFISQGADTQTMCLSRWFRGWASYYFRVSGSTRTGITRAIRIPRYVTSATTLPMLKKLREKFGYAVHDVVADDNGLTIMPNGTMSVLPRREDIDVEMVRQYETELNAVQEELYAKGIPLSTEHDTLRTNLFAIQQNNLDFDRDVQTRAKSLSRFSNVCIGIDPDFAIVVNTSNGGGLSVNETRTVGMKAPQALDLADTLGYDFAEPGEAPNFRSAANVIGNIHHNQASAGMAAYRPANELRIAAAKAEAAAGKLIDNATDNMITFTSTENSNVGELLDIIAQTCQAYEFMLKNKQVPDLPTLIKKARTEIGMDGEGASLSESPMDNSLYTNLIDNDFAVAATAEERPALTMLRVMIRVMNDAAGLRGSNLVATSVTEMGSTMAAMESMPSHTHYFSMSASSQMNGMARLNNYFGGALYRVMCDALARSDRKKLFSSLVESDTAPAADRLQQIILPFATLYSDVIPKSLEIFEQAENEIERLKPDTSITIDDIRIPGLKAGAALLPHQVEAHKTLRKRPRYATIFIAPGGGKTIIGLTDIAAIIQELDDLGEETIRPLIICPTNLVANWCDDLHKVVDGWNAVPITSDTVNTWGEDRMYDVITQSPRNTIHIVGLSFLQTGTFDVDIGGVRVRVRGAVEFVNRFNFSYVMLDESHKVKNFSGGQSGSQVHFNTKAVFTAPSVRYARIATGTLVTDRVKDIVGQAALMTPAMFGDNLDVAYDGAKDNIEMIRRAHSRMSNHTAFIQFKRKHWAFMLPNPIDTFIQVEIDDPTVPNSSLHNEVYQAMYAQVLEKLQEAANSAKRRNAGEDDEEDSGDDAAEDSGIDADEMDDGDDLGALLATNGDLNMYFQRMEMLLTDPMGDDVARMTFEAAGVTDFVSAKVLSIIGRIKKHFEVQPERDTDPSNGSDQQIFEWKPGVVPRELDIAVYQGQKYLARKVSEEYQRQTLPPSMTPPPDDPDYWKPEVQGKLIVFTRYVRAANAIYNALPANYKKLAVVYHGEVGKLGQNKDANLDAFKTDNAVQILIANEQAISEGHNMQMGSRIIRCDTPWSPGVYDQSTARIFRPDVAAAKLDENGKPGDMAREVVFIDWIMTNKTLEVGKVARLMWKTLEKTRFDEKGNVRYEELDRYNLEPIKMSAKLLIDNNTLADFKDYFLAKRDLNDIEAKEFQEMRRTTIAAMLPLPATPALRDFRVMEQTPIVANQKVPDRHGWGLERMLDWARNHNFSNGEMLKDSVHRAPVVTEFGNGLVVSVTVRTVDGKLRADSPISTVRVRLAGTEELVTVPASKVHMATKVSPADFKKFFDVRKPWATAGDRKRAEAEANRVEVEDSIQDETQTADTKATEVRVEAQERKAARIKKRVTNKAEGKPINEGVEEAAKKVRRRKAAELPPLDNKVRKAKPGKSIISLDDTGADMALDLTPTVYNGFVAIYADATDPDAKALKEFDFVEFGDYVYYDCAYYSDFEKMLDFIESKKLEFDNPTARRLEFVQDTFDESTPRLSFNYKLGIKVQSQLKQFFLVKHKTANDKSHVKAYPMVMEDRLRIMFDLSTNPKMKRLVGTKIPNTRKFGTFDQAPGMWIGFVNNVSGAKARINKIVKAGYTITNLKKCITALGKLKLTATKNKSV